MKNDYENFGELAIDNSIKAKQKVGRYLTDDETYIFTDIKEKLTLENKKSILDIGCGCSKPALDLIDFCNGNKSKSLILVDHPKMLENIQNTQKFEENIKFIPGRFPEVKDTLIKTNSKFDAIICYNVLHHITHMNYFKFIDELLTLLAPGGQLLIGDIPNETKKQRFLTSSFGKEFHKKWSGGKETPTYPPNWMPNLYDDSTCIQVLLRYRQLGFETYLLPQNEKLPMCYSREDILIVKNK